MRAACAVFFAALYLSGSNGKAQTAQIVHESLTDWTHDGGTWKDNVPKTDAEFGKVDQLDSTNDLWIRRTPMTLDPGTYVATVRLQKFFDSAGAAPLTFEAKMGTSPVSLVVPVAEQTVGKFIHSRGLLFTAKTKVAVLFSLGNSDQNTTKKNYWFDSFSLGKLDREVERVQSMTRRWSTVWGIPYTSRNVVETGSPFGVVDRINGPTAGGTGLWWAAWDSEWFDTKTIGPGWWTADFRVKKTMNRGNLVPWEYWVTFDVNGSQTNSPRVILDIRDQVVDRWVWSQGLSFFVKDPRTRMRFHFHNTHSSRKADFMLDLFALRRGAFEIVGNGCRAGNGYTSRLRGTPPELGKPFELLADPVPGNNVAVAWFGAQQVKIDLSGANMFGCTLYTPPLVLLPMATSSGVAKLGFPFPNDQGLIGVQWLNQALIPDLGANIFGAITTNAGRAVVVK